MSSKNKSVIGPRGARKVFEHLAEEIEAFDSLACNPNTVDSEATDYKFAQLKEQLQAVNRLFNFYDGHIRRNKTALKGGSRE